MEMEEFVENLKSRFAEGILLYQEREMPVFVVTKGCYPLLVKALLEEKSFQVLLDITAVDYLRWPEPQPQRFELVCHLFSLDYNKRVRIKVPLNQGEEVPSLTSLYGNASWLEREVYDMFGIPFHDHPDLRRILLYDEFQGHPLLKDYPWKREQPLYEEIKDDPNR